MKYIFVLLIGITVIVSGLWIWQGFTNPWYLLREEQYLYIYSTQAQVIAAIYGLTVTGYIFLRNNQDKQIDNDPTLKDAIDLNQKKERNLLFALTFFSLSTILLAVFTLVSLDDKKIISILIKNLCAALFTITIILFCSFILYVLRVNKIEKASIEIKKSIEEHEENKITSQPPMSDLNKSETKTFNNDAVEEKNEESNNNSTISRYSKFFIKFNYLESMINELLDGLYHKQHSYIKTKQFLNDTLKYKRTRTIRSALTELINSNIIDSPLYDDLIEITRYRNALAHGENLNPSKNMLEKTEKVIEKVEKLVLMNHNQNEL